MKKIEQKIQDVWLTKTVIIYVKICEIGRITKIILLVDECSKTTTFNELQNYEQWTMLLKCCTCGLTITLSHLDTKVNKVLWFDI